MTINLSLPWVAPLSEFGSGPSYLLWGRGQVVPGSQVLRPGWAIKHRQDIEVLFQGEGLEDELDPVLIPCGDGPCAVGIIGVAVWEPWALHCPIGALQLERAVLACEREREQFSVAKRSPRSFLRDRSNALEDHEPTVPSMSSGPAPRSSQREGKWVIDTECACCAAPWPGDTMCITVAKHQNSVRQSTKAQRE